MNDKSWRLRVIYCGVLLTAYFGFFLTCAFFPATMARTIGANTQATLAMLLGAAVIAGSVVLTGCYMVAADRS